jgi:phage portal protein BeeE
MDESRFSWETVTVDVHPRGVQQRIAPAGVTSAISSGAVGYGAGGPLYLDQFRSKRAPTPPELVEQFKAIAYSCMTLNWQGVVDVPLRLYAVTRSGDKAPRRNYVRVPVHRRNWLQGRRSLATIMSGANDVHELVEHPYLEALNRPNPFFDGSLMIAYFAACLDAVGRFYLYPERPDPTWAAKQWWPLQPQYVMPIKSGGPKILEKYTYLGQDFAPDELEGGRLISLRDPYLSGMAPMQACYEQLGLTNYYTGVVENVLKNGARPSMMVGPKDGGAAGGWNPDQRHRVEADINAKFARGQQGYIWVVDGTFDAKMLSYPPADLAGLEVNKNARLIAANCFSVPISLLQTEDSNRAVAEAGEYQHQKRAIRPRCTAIASALTKMAQLVDPRLFFCFDDAVQADEERKAKIEDMQIKNGRRTVNEIRDDAGETSVPYGNEPWYSGSLRQPSQITAQAGEVLKKLQAPPPAPTPPPGEDAGKVEPEPKAESTAEETDAERKLNRLALKVLRNVEASQRAERSRVARDRRRRQRSRQETQGAWSGWNTVGSDGREAAQGAIPGPTTRSAGDDPTHGHPAADDDAPRAERHGSLGDGDDADDHGVLGRQPQENPEPTSSQDGPAERPLGGSEGSEPASETADPEADFTVLPGDECDDEAGS